MTIAAEAVHPRCGIETGKFVLTTHSQVQSRTHASTLLYAHRFSFRSQGSGGRPAGHDAGLPARADWHGSFQIKKKHHAQIQTYKIDLSSAFSHALVFFWGGGSTVYPQE